MAAAAMLGERPQAINADVRDAVGELTNMIAGRRQSAARSSCPERQPAQRRHGQRALIDFPKQVTPIAFPSIRLGTRGGRGRIRFDQPV